MLTEEDEIKEGRAQSSIENPEKEEEKDDSPVETVEIDHPPAFVGEAAMKAFVQEIVGLVWKSRKRETLFHRRVLERTGSFDIRGMALGVGALKGIDRMTCRVFQSLMAHFNARMTAKVGDDLIEFSRAGMAVISSDAKKEDRKEEAKDNGKQPGKKEPDAGDDTGDDDSLEDRDSFIV